ncbi:hypothetical protein [Streptomyces sp. NBC_01506]|uniref:hypothetical protein n=1 Tax=Streptomyces sp. NBC_01506 TaxID=2903887 RepID=UPI003867369E
MRTTTAAIGAVLLLGALTACSGGEESTTEAKPSPTPTSSRAYDVHDCKALLERNYEAEALRDATGDPECEHLTQDEYTEVVGEVLSGRKDEIMEDATYQVVWDEAWDSTDADQQQVVCDRLAKDGAVAVGQEMMDDAAGADDESGNPIDMVQYFLDEKC